VTFITPTIELQEPSSLTIPRNWWPLRSWPATAVGRSTLTATICAACSSGGAHHGLPVLEASRPHLEMYRSSMRERGLVASTIDQRHSTAFGHYRFALIDGRISSNPAQYVRRPTVHPSEGRGLDRAELGRFLFTAERFDQTHAALAVLLGLNGLRVSEACETNIEDMAFERGHRVLPIIGKGNKPALIPLVTRTARTIDLSVSERRQDPILLRHHGQRLDRRTAHRWVRSIGKRAGIGLVHPHMLRAAFIMAALDAGVPLREVQVAARHEDPRTTTVYNPTPPGPRQADGLRRSRLRCRRPIISAGPKVARYRECPSTAH
jgi:integrase/recombinase XerD